MFKILAKTKENGFLGTPSNLFLNSHDTQTEHLNDKINIAN